MSIAGERIKILIVEDHLGEADLVKAWLTGIAVDAFEMVHIGTVHAAVRLLSEKRFDVVLLDLSLPDSYGLETILAIREVNPRIPIVVMTGIRHPRLAGEKPRTGVSMIFSKKTTWMAACWVGRCGKPPSARGHRRYCGQNERCAGCR